MHSKIFTPKGFILSSEMCGKTISWPVPTGRKNQPQNRRCCCTTEYSFVILSYISRSRRNNPPAPLHPLVARGKRKGIGYDGGAQTTASVNYQVLTNANLVHHVFYFWARLQDCCLVDTNLDARVFACSRHKRTTLFMYHMHIHTQHRETFI